MFAVVINFLNDYYPHGISTSIFFPFFYFMDTFQLQIPLDSFTNHLLK